MLFRLLDRQKAEVRRQELLFAQCVAATINFGFRAPKEPVRPESFMPSEWGKARKPRRKRYQTRKQVAQGLRQMFFSLMKAQGNGDKIPEKYR